MQNAVLSTDGKATCRYMQVIQAILAQALSLLVHAYQTSSDIGQLPNSKTIIHQQTVFPSDNLRTWWCWCRSVAWHSMDGGW